MRVRATKIALVAALVMTDAVCAAELASRPSSDSTSADSRGFALQLGGVWVGTRPEPLGLWAHTDLLMSPLAMTARGLLLFDWSTYEVTALVGVDFGVRSTTGEFSLTTVKSTEVEHLGPGSDVLVDRSRAAQLLFQGAEGGEVLAGARVGRVGETLRVSPVLAARRYVGGNFGSFTIPKTFFEAGLSYVVVGRGGHVGLGHLPWIPGGYVMFQLGLALDANLELGLTGLEARSADGFGTLLPEAYARLSVSVPLDFLWGLK